MLLCYLYLLYLSDFPTSYRSCLRDGKFAQTPETYMPWPTRKLAVVGVSGAQHDPGPVRWRPFRGVVLPHHREPVFLKTARVQKPRICYQEILDTADQDEFSWQVENAIRGPWILAQSTRFHPPVVWNGGRLFATRSWMPLETTIFRCSCG